MNEILIACGNVELLQAIVADLPPGRFKPIAAKSGTGLVGKLAARNVQLAIVHEQLSSGPGASLCTDLRRDLPDVAILYLCVDAPPTAGPFDVALRYPVPGVVLRNAIGRLAPQHDASQDMERWRAFYDELKQRIADAPTQSYYAILGVAPDAPHHEIVAAYDHLSLRYHPDRYAQHRNEKWGNAVYEATNALFQVVTEAFSVVSDRRLKRVYDRGLPSGALRIDPALQAGGDAGPDLLENHATTKQGKKFLRLAQRDIARSDWAAALQNLQFAASMEGDSPAIAEKIAEVQAHLEK